jgi:hypothetical protein
VAPAGCFKPFFDALAHAVDLGIWQVPSSGARRQRLTSPWRLLFAEQIRVPRLVLGYEDKAMTILANRSAA